eukprot:COSAG05_NODE_1489_length_4725_cov_10.311933_2_plen_81_part_00
MHGLQSTDCRGARAAPDTLMQFLVWCEVEGGLVSLLLNCNVPSPTEDVITSWQVGRDSDRVNNLERRLGATLAVLLTMLC